MASSVKCSQCGAPLEAGVSSCKYCGEAVQYTAAQPYPAQPYPAQPYPPQQPYPAQPYPPQPYYQQPPPQVIVQQPVNQNLVNPNWPVRNKVAAGVLAIFFGGIGVHKFYLARPGMGILYLLLCWTFIPAIIAVIEGIIYLCQSDYDFQLKNRVRTS